MAKSKATGSWLHPTATGGLYTSNIDAQDWHVLFSLSDWLADPDFTAVGVETSSDVTVHYSNRASELVQVKAGALKPSQLRDCVVHFRDLYSEDPNAYCAYRVVARTLTGSGENLAQGLDRVRLVRQAGSDVEKTKTLDDFRQRVQKTLGDSWDEEWLLSNVYLEPLHPLRADMAHSYCKEGLRKLGLSEDNVALELIVAAIADKLRALRASAGGLLRRADIKQIIEATTAQLAAANRRAVEAVQTDSLDRLAPAVRAYSVEQSEAIRNGVGEQLASRPEWQEAQEWLTTVGTEGGTLFLVGDPGTGKTILLAQLLPVAAALPNALPVWIDLSNVRALRPIREMQLPIGVAVQDIIRVSLEHGIQPILMVDTLDRVDPEEALTLFDGLGAVTMIVSDRTAHFAGLDISKTSQRIELAALADE